MKSEAPAARIRDWVDVVYFLMFPGWEDELRSNRWHYARRWARYVPVVLLQPTQKVASPSLKEAPEPGVPNCTVLQIKSADLGSFSVFEGLTQCGQLHAHMHQHGFERAALWAYNPCLVCLYSTFPAVARVFHGTENYTAFEGLDRSFHESLRAMLDASDVIVAVSEGVAASLRAQAPKKSVAVVTNGCDYAEYSRGVPDPELARLRAGGGSVAIYAGNVNSRLDFSLLNAVAEADPSRLIAILGPVNGLTPEDHKRWEELLFRPNVRYLGSVPPERLPHLYAAADVGLLPYKRTPLIVENGFPLKTLEMGATGLPVVATAFASLRGLARSVVVAESENEFVGALAATSRATLSTEDVDELEKVCARNDYDRKFDEVLARIEPLASPQPTTRADVLLSTSIRELWAAETILYSQMRWGPRLRWWALRVALTRRYVALSLRVPRRVRSLLPDQLRTLLRRALVSE